MQGHIIVSGEDALMATIIEELTVAGMSFVKLVDDEVADTEGDLAEAGIASAAAVICAGDDDATNLEIALLAREANPDVRIVARLANGVLRAGVAADNGPGAILDVAALAAPAVVGACLAHTAHPLEAAGVAFVVSATHAPRDATLRELYGDLAPVAVIRGDNASNPGALVACPGRDLRVHTDDLVAVIAPVDEAAARGISLPAPASTRLRQHRLRRALDAVRMLRNEVNPAFYYIVGLALTLLVGSTVLLRFAYRTPAMDWIDALYFSTETITTVGFGDFSFTNQPAWLRLYSVMLMVAGVTSIALLVAVVADLLLSRRFTRSAGRWRVRHLRDHVIVVGLGALGIRVVNDLTAAGYAVAVIERDENNRFLSLAADLNVPVIFGDATLHQTLESARVDVARAVAVLTHDDMVNIEIGIVLREMSVTREPPGVDRSDPPIVLRVYDRSLGAAVAKRFCFDEVRSTVAIAAPWFVGAAMGLQLVSAFSV
ncbi:MAG: NAD-binding protein, partial [Mycobacterium sp.]